MRKNKRIVAAALAAALIVTALSGCGKKDEEKTKDQAAGNVTVKKTGYPVVDQAVKIRALGFGEPGGGEWSSFPILQDISKQTNVEVDWQTVSGEGSTEKLNLIMSSKDIPDAVFSGLSTTQITQYASKGVILPLEDLIEEYAPNIKKILDENPAIRKAITLPDGHIYAIPSINEDELPVQSTTLNINKVWLDKLGLKEPATTDEFKAVLEAFKTKDPNGNGEADEIPFSFEPKTPYNIWNGDTGLSGAFGVTDSSEHLMMKDDKLVYTPVLEGYKDYVKWFRELYTGGLIDREVYTQDHNQYIAKINSDRLGAYLTNGPVKVAQDNYYITIKPLKGPNGDQLWSSLDFSIDKNRGLITTANKYPEATMRYIDSFYEPMNSLKLRHGIYLEEREDSKYEILPTDSAKKSMAPGAYVATCVPKKIVDQYLIKTEDTKKSDERKELYREFLTPAIPLMNFTPEETKEISSLNTDLAKVADESKAKWVTGQSDVDAEWDAYVASLEKIGLSRYLELYATALERFRSN